jgi:hypothetical protein
LIRIGLRPTWLTIAVKLSGCHTTLLIAYLMLLSTDLVWGQDTAVYPTYQFLSESGSDALSEQMVQRVARELAKDRLANQFGARRQNASYTLAVRMVSMRRFTAKLEDFKRLASTRESPPLDIFPDRYLSTEGLLDAGRREADKRLAAGIVDHWLRQSHVSRLELALWDALDLENPRLFSNALRFLVSDAERAVGRLVLEVRRQPYRLIEQLVEQQTFTVQANTSEDETLHIAVRAMLEEAGLTPSAELVLHARIMLRPRIQNALDRNAGAHQTQLMALSRAWQRPCDWNAQERNHLLLAADLLYRSGTSLASLTEANLGTFSLYVIGLPLRERLELLRGFEQRSWLKAVSAVDELIEKDRSLGQRIEDLRSELALPGGFQGDTGVGASAQWIDPIVLGLEDDLRGKTPTTSHPSTSDPESFLEEALVVLTRRLEATWREIVTVQIQERQTRIAKLNAVNLGDLQQFESFNGWPLREQVRLALEATLHGQGWSKGCTENYFISRALDARAEQLAGVVTRVFGN